MNTNLWCPFADREPVVNHGGTMGCYSYRQRSLGILLHVTAGYGDPSGWFNTPAAQASAIWYVAKTGRLAQYMPATDRAWAQMNGNDTYQSVETEGEPGEPLTDAQVETLARLYAWAQTQPELAWPLQEANANGQEGFGWHGMDPGFGHPFCPGELRKAQRPAILARAVQLLGTPSEDDVALTSDQAAAIALVPRLQQQLTALTGLVQQLAGALTSTNNNVQAVFTDVHSTLPYIRRIDGNASAVGTVVDLVKAIPAPSDVKVSLDPTALQGAVEAALVANLPAIGQAILPLINLKQVTA